MTQVPFPGILANVSSENMITTAREQVKCFSRTIIPDEEGLVISDDIIDDQISFRAKSLSEETANERQKIILMFMLRPFLVEKESLAYVVDPGNGNRMLMASRDIEPGEFITGFSVNSVQFRTFEDNVPLKQIRYRGNLYYGDVSKKSFGQESNDTTLFVGDYLIDGESTSVFIDMITNNERVMGSIARHTFPKDREEIIFPFEYVKFALEHGNSRLKLKFDNGLYQPTLVSTCKIQANKEIIFPRGLSATGVPLSQHLWAVPYLTAWGQNTVETSSELFKMAETHKKEMRNVLSFPKSVQPVSVQFKKLAERYVSMFEKNMFEC